ncbi:MAG: DUF3494 domain-containing protein [Proteobacteria bacterium]|nr:DUF3494 domain-containing protein [Pseudomonadota bacterium]MBU1687104.1 DUF3494 domain-containing protein [Pseudomonadota bacterium]
MYFGFLSLLSVLFLAGCGGGNGSWDGGNTDTSIDSTAPTVTSTAPVNEATGVAIGNKLTATFSEEMDGATINTTTFTLKQGATAISGMVSYVGVTAIFAPAANLTTATSYTATIRTGAKDLAGNALASDSVWSFTTGTDLDVDTISPTVTLIVPADVAIDVAKNITVSATFSEAMDPSTITNLTFTLKHGATTVEGTVTYAGQVATFKPTQILAADTVYTATITTGTADLVGNAVAVDKVWTFTTGAAQDSTAPSVTSTLPADYGINVALSQRPQATFSEAMDPLTITNQIFTLKQGITAVNGTVTYVGLVATFKPTLLLANDTTYTATITTAAKDLSGNALTANKVWTFTTIGAGAMGPAPVDLGMAGNFVLLTKTGITTTGVTAITGDIGVSPIDSTGMTGFGATMDPSNVFSTSSLVIGRLYAADYAMPTPTNMTTSVSDMETAYTDAAGRSLPDFTELGAGDISGMNLAPGLYKWGTGVLIDLNGVTLTGGANDVWIFQIADDLTVSNGAIITLAGNAQAQNVFWQVGGGTGVTLGTTVQMQGIILATKAITFDTGATLTGRALAQTNVTLDANTITAP